MKATSSILGSRVIVSSARCDDEEEETIINSEKISNQRAVCGALHDFWTFMVISMLSASSNCYATLFRCTCVCVSIERLNFVNALSV